MFQRIALIVSFILISSVANAADPKDVQELVAYMTGAKPNAKGVKAELHKAMSDEHSQTYRIVFVADGVRYTMQYITPDDRHFPPDPNLEVSGSLGFWDRPDGTTRENVRRWYSDDGLDGKIAVGNGPKNNPYMKKYKGEVLGSENREEWQQAYDHAVALALKYFRTK